MLHTNRSEIPCTLQIMQGKGPQAHIFAEFGPIVPVLEALNFHCITALNLACLPLSGKVDSHHISCIHRRMARGLMTFLVCSIDMYDVLGSIIFISQYIMSSIQTDTGHEDMNDLKNLGPVY